MPAVASVTVSTGVRTRPGLTCTLIALNCVDVVLPVSAIQQVVDTPIACGA